jgi:hypothetical protein
MGTDHVAMGTVTNGIPPGALISRIVDFVRTSLADWREWRAQSGRKRSDAEMSLNASLCKYLNARAKTDLPMVAFNHEDPEGRRRVDISITNALLASGDIDEPIVVLEGKRLPPDRASREREYLTGREERSGGVQRFKLALHGAALSRGMLVAYVQGGSVASWLDTINAWIGELARTPHDEHDAWGDDELLCDFVQSSNAVAWCDSEHARITGDRVRLHHAWVQMEASSAR